MCLSSKFSCACGTSAEAQALAVCPERRAVWGTPCFLAALFVICVEVCCRVFPVGRRSACEGLTCSFTRSVFPCVALGCGKGCSWPLTSLDAAAIRSQLQMQILREGTLSLWSRPTLPSRYFLFWFWWLKKSGTPFFLGLGVLELLVGEFASSSTPQASD